MEKHFSIDPGKGEKMEGCPYSVFEDGRDVKDYIIPPKGYTFTGFKFKPLVNNQIYDGKLVAQYERASIHDRLTSNLWKVLIPVIIVTVISIVVLLAVSIFRNPKPHKTNTPKTPTETSASPIDTNTIVSTPIVDTTKPNVVPVHNEDDVIADQVPTSDTVKEEKPEQNETPQPAPDEPNAQFKQEFWTLIHDCTFAMDSYHDLYINYKDKVEGEEFNYLRFTILKDYVSYKAWYNHLKKIPKDQLQSINTVDELKKRLNEINE